MLSLVDKAPLATEDDLEVGIGDLVRYVDIAKPDEVLTVRITHTATDLAKGSISKATPLAQALLGAAVGDEVPLLIAGGRRRVFRITSIARPSI